ncbi:MAG: hypothetical protein BMS9Abin28_0710 [Anaerolineae bacterium]|nr:MAG: hypothetical protein BMS9Abin28_0710 [Anaerolineae bacterium]
MTMPSNKSKRNRQAERNRRALRRRRVLWAVAGGLGVFVAWAVISNQLPTTKVQPAAEPAPDITLTTQQGEYRLSEQKGETVALFFAFVG